MTLAPTQQISPAGLNPLFQYKVVLCKVKKQEPKQRNILGLKEQDPPVCGFQFKHMRFLLVVGGLGRQRVVHTHSVFQILFRQGLFWLIFIL